MCDRSSPRGLAWKTIATWHAHNTCQPRTSFVSNLKFVGTSSPRWDCVIDVHKEISRESGFDTYEEWVAARAETV